MAPIRPLVALLAIFTLAACGGGEPAEPTDANAATVEPYARVVAEHDGEWRASVDESDFACADSSTPDSCAAAYQSGSEQAQALRDDLSAARDGHEVPDEVAALIADTEAAAEGYSAAYEAWAATGCVYPLNTHCGADEALAMFKAQGELTRQLDAWEALTS
jgi:hypothetical protein